MLFVLLHLHCTGVTYLSTSLDASLNIITQILRALPDNPSVVRHYHSLVCPSIPQHIHIYLSTYLFIHLFVIHLSMSTNPWLAIYSITLLTQTIYLLSAILSNKLRYSSSHEIIL